MSPGNAPDRQTEDRVDAVPDPLVTVAICTWNRCESLRRTLARMTEMQVPQGVEWELIVVNNRCTDATDEVIESFAGQLPLRRAWEPQPGLSNARNRAVMEARGRYIVWTDDDILVDEGWLAAYVGAFRRWSDAVVFGGPIEPEFEGVPPRWLPPILDRVGAVYGRQNLGDAPVSLGGLKPGSGPYGGNMAMRAEVLRRFRFDPALGVTPDGYSVGEETDVIQRLLAAGFTGWWIPDARVRHWIPSSSQNLAYIRRWMIGAGRYRAQKHAAAGRPVRRRQGLRLAARIVRYEAQYRLRRAVLPPQSWITDLIRASQALGELQVWRAEYSHAERPDA
jgi:glucosyl-dolichyl phosphate glucuronosyltransferase